MSPIFVRPVREQAEHDRLVRFLLAKYKRKYDEAQANVGDDQLMPIKVGPAMLYPDLLLIAQRKMTGVVEVESAESVNRLEAMAQWVPFGRSKVSFFLYVPVPAYEAAKRLCDAHSVTVAEIWTYRPTSDGFDLIRTFHDASAAGGSIAVKALPLPKPAKIETPEEPEPEPEKPVKPSKSSKLEKLGKLEKPGRIEKPSQTDGRANANTTAKSGTPSAATAAAKAPKPGIADKFSRSEKPGKPEKLAKAEKPGQAEKPTKAEKPAKAERPAKVEKQGKPQPATAPLKKKPAQSKPASAPPKKKKKR